MGSSKKSPKAPRRPSKRLMELAQWDSSGSLAGLRDLGLNGMDSDVESDSSSPEMRSQSLKSMIKTSALGSKNFDTKSESKKSEKTGGEKEQAQPESEETGGGSKHKRWFWKKKKSDKKDEEEPTNSNEPSRHSVSTTSKTVEPKRNSMIIENCETEFHEAIRNHDWGCLEGLLKEYDPTLYKQRKKANAKPKKKLKILKHIPEKAKLPKKLRKDKEEEMPISPLLALDTEGRTPLHLCCFEPTPSKLLLRAMNCERYAATIKDKAGNLPIHLAVQTRRSKSVIERLIRGHYQGSWEVDGQKRTPLMIAIEVVIKKQDEEKIKATKTYWGFPVSPEDIRWQENQKRVWEIPTFLMQNRIDRKKRLLNLEYPQVIVALNRCAPPEAIANFLAAGRKSLLKEEVAQKILFLLISRQYPITLFKWYLQVVTLNFVKEQSDFSGCGVVAAHFRVGCTKHVDSKTKRERDSFAITMKRLAYAKKHGKDSVLTPQYTEWWEKLKLFVNLWASDYWDDKENAEVDEKHLLHNALMNPDAPPLLIQLLALLYPESITMNHPKVIALPIHFACRQWKFKEFPPRRGEKIVKLDQICEEFLKVDKTLTRKRNRERLPLHDAIVAGKNWDFIKPLVTHDSESLLIRDPTTFLRPFQMAALKIHQTFDIEAVARRQFLPHVWNTMRNDERAQEMSKLLQEYDLKQVDLVFELLRNEPTAVTKVLSAREILMEETKKQNERLARENLMRITRTKMCRTLFRLGNVEGHFIGWCYESDGRGVWKAHRHNFPMVKEAIIDGFVPRKMDKWWSKLKFWLWQDCPWDIIPRRADFLLHCALCNPKVSPWIVELILECFPRSATIPLPHSGGCYPLHIACITDTYAPLPFEFANKRSVIEMVAKSYREAILVKWNDTLPLHYAIEKRKDWSEMKYMAENEPVSLAIPDSVNDFFPFQLMALHKLYTKMEIQRFVNIAMIEIGKSRWEKTSEDERTAKLKEVLLQHETDSVGCTFELLKRNPMLVHVGTRGDGVDEPVQKGADRISMEDYLNILDRKKSSEESEVSSDLVVNNSSKDSEASVEIVQEKAPGILKQSSNQEVDDSSSDSDASLDFFGENLPKGAKSPSYLQDDSSVSDSDDSTMDLFGASNPRMESVFEPREQK